MPRFKSRCCFCGESFYTNDYKQRLCPVCDPIAKEVLAIRRKREGKEEETPPEHFVRYKKRPCHDCGKPTYSYRCDECWQKRSQKLGIEYFPREFKEIEDIEDTEEK